MMLALIRAIVEHKFVHEYQVVDVHTVWSATTPFRELPKISMTSDLGTSQAKSVPMLSPSSIQLITRFIERMEGYFDEIHEDRLLSLVINPLLATFGCNEIKILLPQNGEGKKLVAKAKQLLKDYLRKLMKNKAPDTEYSPGSEVVDSAFP